MLTNDFYGLGDSSVDELPHGNMDQRRQMRLRTGSLVLLDSSSIMMLEQQAAQQFNSKPKACVEFLVNKGLIEGSPQELADFFLDRLGLLSKRRLGEYFGSGKDFNQAVCEHFMSKLDFEALPLDGALRILLKQFRLPKEAQQIDRILDKFARHYYSGNSGMFNSSDAVYILSFSLIMLNTDLHNPNIKEDKKMTLTQFLRNNREIDDGSNVSAELLSTLYYRIKNDEIKMNDVDMYESENVAFIAPRKAGWLQKMPEGRIASFLSWGKCRRWFVLTDGCLYYFHKPNDQNPRGIIPLDNVSPSRGANAYDLKIMSSWGGPVKSSKILESGSMRAGVRVSFTLRAETEEQRDAWVRTLKHEAERLKPLHDIFIRLQQKKAGKGKFEDRLDLPRPLAKGWMRKRSSHNPTWMRRYFQLFPDFDGAGPTLFYFVSRESAQMMADLGQQTQSGYLRMRTVTRVEYVADDSVPSIVVHVKGENITWTFVPEVSETDSLRSDSDMDSEMESVAGTDYNEEYDEGYFASSTEFWHYVLKNNKGDNPTPKKQGASRESGGSELSEY